jgi:transposase
MDNDKKGYIRYLKNTEKRSISEIARYLGVDRKTVRRALKEDSNDKRRKRSSKLDPFKKRIDQILSETPYISNVLIFDTIRQEGYPGGKSILGDYLLKLRRKNKEAFHHIETLPGAEAQVDWASCGPISCGEHKRKLYLFCMVLSYSRCMYITFTTGMDSDTFMACHIKAFRFFGGQAKSLLYDNLKSVVSFRYGKDIILNERFSDFASYYGFTIKVCNVRRGNEKGKVERAIRYVKENFLSRKNYENFDMIKAEASLWLREIANRRIHSTTRQRPLDMFINEEKALLLKLPQKDYDYPLPRPVKPRKDCLFSFDSNRYSIPAEYYNKSLLFKAYTDRITVVCEKETIAVHKRCYDKYQTISNPDHYAALKARKKKAAQNMAIERFKALCPEAESYLKGLMKNQNNVYYHLNQILSLEQMFDKTAVAGALVHALSFEAFHWEFIKNIVLNTQQIKASPKPLLEDNEALMNIRVKEPDLSNYDRLTKKGHGK